MDPCFWILACWTQYQWYHHTSGPLAILKDSWCGDENLPVNFGKNATTYLRELHEKLEISKSYAASHGEREQNRYAAHYNLRSRDKHFDVSK